jgi:hypothetical protein
MPDSIHETLEIVRNSPTADLGWPKLLDLCRKHAPSPIWYNLRHVDPEADVVAAASWLSQQFSSSTVQPPRGIYLGLDTLNQKSGPCKNVEIAFSNAANPEQLSQDWLYDHDANWYGSDHLIRSLVAVKDVYDPSDVSEFADYTIFLGYSGLVLAEALERVSPPGPFLAVWGFHDGDLFYLSRRTTGAIERVASL